MDNNFVFCVSTVHKTGKTIKRLRKKPRVTPTNRNHVEEVWGKDGVKEIYIPVLINDYNHWMGGVDLIDQWIAYYDPKMRCICTWLPIFIQILSLVRNNAFHVHKDHMEKKGKNVHQKQFLLDTIRVLLENAHKHKKIEELLTPTKQNLHLYQKRKVEAQAKEAAQNPVGKKRKTTKS